MMNLANSYLDLPYEQRWEYLRPTMVQMYLEGKATLAQLAQRMADEFSFKAEIHQYRYHFKKWEIRKRITTVEKEAVITALGKRRRQQGMGTSSVHFEQGGSTKVVDKKQLKRHINDSIRRQIPQPLQPGTFLSHTLPYTALIRRIRGDSSDSPSPLSNGPQTPAYLTVASPQTLGSPQDAMSPTTQLLHRKVLIDRSRLLLSGREVELMRQMSSDERRVTADWLHDFWMFSFVTTKYWGKGPEDWTLPLINAKTLAMPAIEAFDGPTQLCNWSIHYRNGIRYEYTVSQLNRPSEHDGDQDIEDESTWRRWDRSDRDLTTTMTQGLQANHFTTYQAEDLPLALDCITDAVSRSPKDATVEAIGFAIITRNLDVLIEYLDPDISNFDPDALRQLSPFHLAAKFLDGSKACCGLMNELVQQLDGENSIGVNYTDELGMTVLDTLLISILRSHTSATTLNIEGNLAASGPVIEGGDVDTCGRWDADSPCVRHLHAKGKTTIPIEWKHMFCHTSVQAVCHCISAIFMSPWAPNINTASGLFRRRCRSCGLELKLGSLHAFVLVCFHLANSGRPGETLFGALACLVSLLTLKADSTSSMEISIPAVLGLEETDECQHRALNAADLASAVPVGIVSSWTCEVQLGWQAVKEVLNHRVARAQASTVDAENGPLDCSNTPKDAPHEYDGHVEQDDDSCCHVIHYYEDDLEHEIVQCGDKRLGTIWAAVQVELLTYRRLGVEDSWLSSMFQMRDVVEGLRAKDDSIIRRLVENRGQHAFRPFSHCGIFKDAGHPGCVRREEACASYFANLDDWKRTTFIAAREDFDMF